ncbi:MAG TPA: di-heme oxidoredictase family protein, partial [Pirellulales bacterium]|nr:di-heme oxidoredictase family protein [Pirellulales bacterium]
MAAGRELFNREWLPGDSRAHGGDGLGPVYNDSSCIACHSQGGVGGSGPSSKNVDIVSAFTVPMTTQGISGSRSGLAGAVFNGLFGQMAPAPGLNGNGPIKPLTKKEQAAIKAQDKETLKRIHPGFASSRSVVVHHFGTDPGYAEWRNGILNGQMQALTEPVQLNATAATPAVEPATPVQEAQAAAAPAETSPAASPIPGSESDQALAGPQSFTGGLAMSSSI